MGVLYTWPSSVANAVLLGIIFLSYIHCLDPIVNYYKGKFSSFEAFSVGGRINVPLSHLPSSISAMGACPETGGEIWKDHSNGPGAPLSELTEDPSFEVLFKQGPEIVSRDIGGSEDATKAADALEPVFIFGEDSSRTMQNCFILSLYLEAEDQVLQKLSQLLQIFDGETEANIEKALKGSLTCFPRDSLPKTILKKIKWIKTVERDSLISSAQIQTDAPWGLSRISAPNLPVSHTFGFRYTGKGVTVYVMDSGVYTKHQEFGGRARVVKSFYPDASDDCSGHGTETSSVVAGRTVGVAKNAWISAIRVLDCSGNGKNSDLIRALDFVLKSSNGPSVINMSLGGSNRSAALDAAISAIVDKGIPIVVAAGNENTDACTKSPSSNPYVLTVGATSISDHRSSYSNYGQCVDLFAPGDKVTAACNSGDSSYNTPSGTSLSAPFVTGIIAQIMEESPGQPVPQVYKRAMSLATSGKIDQDSLNESPNLIAQAMPFDPTDPTQYADLYSVQSGGFEIHCRHEFLFSVLSVVLIL